MHLPITFAHRIGENPAYRGQADARKTEYKSCYAMKRSDPQVCAMIAMNLAVVVSVALSAIVAVISIERGRGGPNPFFAEYGKRDAECHPAPRVASFYHQGWSLPEPSTGLAMTSDLGRRHLSPECAKGVQALPAFRLGGMGRARNELAFQIAIG